MREMRKRVENVIYKVAECSSMRELNDLAMKLSLAKESFDDLAWSFVTRALSVREEELLSRCNALADCGELRADEIL
ncbi:MAG TPA: hypothetical protein EYH01_01580 [Campylobacterales bacterium]|nr:hypothetical protein [Campylobacterales bacterium]